MDPKFKVMMHVSRPVAEVFEAVVDPGQLSQYFATGEATKGRLESGTTVTWDFHDFPGAFPVEVEEVVANERIVLHWQANDGADDPYNTTVTMTFAPVDDNERTLVEIEEHGWRDTPEGIESSYGNCMGWSQMLAALKAWKEYGINLRLGAYK